MADRAPAEDLLAEMAAAVSHEVRNPLAGVGGALQVLRDRLTGAPEERAIIVEILDRLKRLDERIDAFSLFARPLTPNRVPVSLDGIARQAAARLCGSAAFGEQLQVRVDGQLATTADARLIDVALSQLLLNAAQALDGAGTIAITVRPASRAPLALVEVKDDGPGVAEDLGDRVFKPFFSTRANGVGLGLTIARRVAEAHGGDVRLAPGNPGTVARLELPQTAIPTAP